ncbi:MAG: FUSC family protein [Caulobacteraceae bacterium]
MTAEHPPAPAWSARGLSRRALKAAGRRQAELRHAVRVSAAVACAFAVSSLFHLPQGYWAVFTAVIVVQTSIGATLTASMDRLYGTIVGGAIGVAGAYLKAQTVLEEGLVLAGAIAICAFAAAVRPNLKVAPITAAIVLVGGSAARMDPLLAAVWRVVEIFIGSAIGVAATVFIFPARAHKAVTARIARTTEELAGLLDLYAEAALGAPLGDRAQHANQATRASLAAIETAVKEAARESSSRLSEASVPEALLRTLGRVRTDTVMVGRALARPAPEAASELLSEPAAALLRAAASELRHCGQALTAGREVVFTEIAQPRARFEQAVEAMRQARLTSDLTFDAAAQVFGLVFALETLLGNMEDLADRIGDLVDEEAHPAAVAAP